MASNQLMIVISVLLLLPLAFHSVTAVEDAPSKTVEKNVDVVVEGMVYCQSCEQLGTWSLAGAEPISAAKVAFVCKDHRDGVSFYKAIETDAHGYFYAQMEGFKMSHNLLDHPLHSCHVKLVSSPLENCNLLSNVNYGLNGSPLRYDNKRLFGKNYEAVIYAAGPLAFRPAHCTPITHP
uniref:Putative pistil-specific extensin-like protein n=1 Tax=Davidia involucrata TaxID=16924 RepID=A0A5B7C673_DAVIN